MRWLIRIACLSPAALVLVVGVTVAQTRSLSHGHRYTGTIETGSGLDLTPSLSRTLQILEIANTGRAIQQLLVTVDTEGTCTIRAISASLQLDPRITKVDYGNGGVYLPEHQTKPLLISHSTYHWIWDLGDLPTGYHEVIALRLRLDRPKLHYGYLLNVHSYAGFSPDETPDRRWEVWGGGISLQF